MKDFNISNVKEKDEYWEIEMLEKQERIPALLSKTEKDKPPSKWGKGFINLYQKSTQL